MPAYTRRALARAGLAALASLALPRAARAAAEQGLDAGAGGDPAARLGNEAYWHDLAKGEPAPPETPPAPPLGEQVAAFALGYVGRPYVSGGTTPAGWDCSGFVQWTMRQFGIWLPRVTTQQIGAGEPVDPADLTPGDLVFFDTERPYPGHVGIFVGGGQMVNAASPALGTVVSSTWNSYWAPLYHGARRVT